jgi:hypothetical protein
VITNNNDKAVYKMKMAMVLKSRLCIVDVFKASCCYY